MEDAGCGEALSPANRGAAGAEVLVVPWDRGCGGGRELRGKAPRTCSSEEVSASQLPGAADPGSLSGGSLMLTRT